MPTNHTIRQIKRQDYHLPSHWVSDWLLSVLQKPATFLITESDYSLSDSELTQFNEGIAKMQAGTPLAYLTGKQAFWSLDFIVNAHTLIPRPDTEVLVEQVLNWIAKSDVHKPNTHKVPKRLLDLGTGSGCIAISLAYELAKLAPQQWHITAIDDSTEALSVAKRNATLNHISNIEFYQSDWFAVFDNHQIHTNHHNHDSQPQFAVIVSNPPYIDPADTHLPQLTAEPLSALVADDKGLADIKLICNQAKRYLVQGGLLALEHGHDQGDNVRRIFAQNGFSEVQTLQDYGGNDRITLGVWR